MDPSATQAATRCAREEKRRPAPVGRTIRERGTRETRTLKKPRVRKKEKGAAVLRPYEEGK